MNEVGADINVNKIPIKTKNVTIEGNKIVKTPVTTESLAPGLTASDLYKKCIGIYRHKPKTGESPKIKW